MVIPRKRNTPQEPVARKGHVATGGVSFALSVVLFIVLLVQK